jgi:predicted Zn-dependent protease
MENAGRKPSVFKTESHAQAEQVEADRFGIALVSLAGYDARAYSGIYDRLVGTEGNTGSFFSRLFGTTSPDSRRLADAIKTSARLPAECAAASPSDPAAYRA